MIVEIKSGSILHWENFQFPDGASKNKYIVVLGCKPGCNWLAAIATSQKKNKEYTMGCHDDASYYHIPGGGKDFFQKDTWLVLAECREVSLTGAQRHLASGILVLKGCLSSTLAICRRKPLQNKGLALRARSAKPLNPPENSKNGQSRA